MRYPAIDVRGVDADFLLAVVDDFAPSAVDELDGGVSIFFATSAKRDDAATAIAAAMPDAIVSAREVDDEDWARRSQQNLTPITVGRITVTPPWFAAVADLQPPASDHISITITPSMGFGTGHHASTRLCLAALQTLTLQGTTVLDVGTGSGVLAIAAARLGARDVLGIDFDPDAIASAQESLEANPEVRGVTFQTVDVREAALPRATVVLANLTGAVLVQNASLLRSAVATGGTLIVSGVQAHERAEVLAAFGGATLCWSDEEAGWVGLAFNLSSTPGV